jgi:hypothetical protein
MEQKWLVLIKNYACTFNYPYQEKRPDPQDLINLGGVIKSEVIQSFIESNLAFNGNVSLKPT